MKVNQQMIEAVHDYLILARKLSNEPDVISYIDKALDRLVNFEAKRKQTAIAGKNRPYRAA